MNPPILLFDDSCGVCHWAVRFVLRHDRAGRFRFSPLASPTGRRLMEAYRVDSAIDSVVLLDDGDSYVQSAAMVQVFRRLGGAWRLLGVVAIVPRSWRDRLYTLLARRRKALSHRFALSCSPPTTEQRWRFLD